jgi:molybdate transport system substrate-binding protein
MFSCSGKENRPLTIATAANMQFTMDSIITVFQSKHNIECKVVASSSGVLTTQIQNGAPYDVFVSANMRYPNELIKIGYGDTVETYAFGRLAVIYSKGKKYTSIEDLLLDPSVKRIAIADERVAPYGIAAREYLRKSGLEAKIADKLILGESVGQVNQYIKTNSVDAAFTSYSFVHKFKKKHQVLEVDQDMFSKINQGVIALNKGLKTNPKETKLFLEFLKSDDCKSILTHFGYYVEN